VSNELLNDVLDAPPGSPGSRSTTPVAGVAGRRSSPSLSLYCEQIVECPLGPHHDRLDRRAQRFHRIATTGSWVPKGGAGILQGSTPGREVYRSATIFQGRGPAALGSRWYGVGLDSDPPMCLNLTVLS
jgi:hypothetical protein